jgi:hypothetical protein
MSKPASTSAVRGSAVGSQPPRQAFHAGRSAVCSARSGAVAGDDVLGEQQRGAGPQQAAGLGEQRRRLARRAQHEGDHRDVEGCVGVGQRLAARLDQHLVGAVPAGEAGACAGGEALARFDRDQRGDGGREVREVGAGAEADLEHAAACALREQGVTQRFDASHPVIEDAG